MAESHESSERSVIGPAGQAVAAAVKKTRGGRVLRTIRRMSSSPSLIQLGRARSMSDPYAARSSPSCASLEASLSSPGSASAGAAAATAAGADALAMYDGIESRLAMPMTENVVVGGPTTPKPKPAPTPVLEFWAGMPHEIKIHILSYLQPRELVVASRVSTAFHRACFDGQLWTSFDGSDFYQTIPAESLTKILAAAGPFVRDLNLRGCVQVEHYRLAEAVVKACRNLVTATLEGCRNFGVGSLHGLIAGNERLSSLDLTGLTAVTNASCAIIAAACPQLAHLNVSWCAHVDAAGLGTIIRRCGRLRDLRAAEVGGFDDLAVAGAMFETNMLEILILSGCSDLTDQALRTMLLGPSPGPDLDPLTDAPLVPARRIRLLDLTRCVRLTNDGVRALAHVMPFLEGLLVTGCGGVGDQGLAPVLETLPRLTHLEMEDMRNVTDRLLADHLAKAACAPRMRHLSVSHCESVTDAGVVPVLLSCVALRTAYLDNTGITNTVLTTAAAMVQARSVRTRDGQRTRPKATLHLVVYDCPAVSPAGVRHVLYRNALVQRDEAGGLTYPTEVVSLKCYYGHQQTVDEHMRRVLRGDFPAAHRLGKKWGDYLQAIQEAAVVGPGSRRRRRRARESAVLHADEEERGGRAAAAAAGFGNGGSRRRARTMMSCTVM